MLWYCKFSWHEHTTREQVARRVLQQHEAGTNHPEHIKGWYNLAGGGAGFVLVDAEDPHELTAFWQPYMDLMSVDIHAIYPLNYDQLIGELRQQVGKVSAPA